MTRFEIHLLHGAPKRAGRKPSGETSEYWEDFVVRYHKDTEKLVEIEFYDHASLGYQGLDIYSDVNAFEKLSAFDGNPLIGVGTVVFLKLGLATWNLQDVNGPRTVCLFCRGRWDNALARLTPLNSHKP